MLICHLYIFFDEVSVWIFCSFFNQLFIFLLLNFKSSLYILDMSFANIFSQSVACFLTFLTVSFTDQKFLILMKFCLSIISFMVLWSEGLCPLKIYMLKS